MEAGFLKDLIYNICLLLGVGVVYSEFNLRPARPARYRDILTGVLLGVVGVAVMLNPWVMRPGMVFDVRSVLLSVGGVFFGPVSALLAAVITALFRYEIGGDGVWMGIAVIFCSAGIGVLWRRLRPQVAEKASLLELALFGLAVHLGMLACTALLPAGTALETLRRIALPVLLAYPAATVVFAMLLLRQAERARGRLALVESEERYRAVSEYSNNAICIVSDSGAITWVNKRMEDMGGFSKAEYLGAGSFARFIAPESLEFVLSNFKKFLAGLPYEHHYVFAFVRADGVKRLCEKYMTDFRDRYGRRNLVISMVDITEQRKAEAEREQLLRAIEQAGDAIVITDAAGLIQYVNPAFEKSTGYTRAEALGKNPSILKSGAQDAEFYRRFWAALSAGETWESRMVNRRKDGTLYTEEAVISAVRDADGRIVNYVAVKRDITENLQMEEQFRQAQKMEAVGHLAGGVAHDFNNILTAIKGYCSLVSSALPAGSPSREDIGEIINAADKATALTGQLLAFSRRQIMTPKVVDVNKIIGDMTKMLLRLIGEEVKLSTHLLNAPCLAKVDPGQIEQVILNLVINARDALREKGEIILETGICDTSGDEVPWKTLRKAGRLVFIRVRDNGCGMSELVKSHLFEPFFTTKASGKGTGLGLSVVFGVIKQSGGEIAVDSAPGKGSVFSIYLPFVKGEAAPGEAEGGSSLSGGSETILLAEDEESLRRLGERLLKAAGYTVLAAASGAEALRLMEERGRPVDLLLTDVVMPGLTGRQLAKELAARKLCPRTLYMSGYTDEAIVKHGVLEPGIAFIYKPFSADGLANKVRAVLDGPADQARA
ncbi:MAG: PAS domain S-box protein [Elusimicrobiales bacterium]|nr:PAS domain S-box protein [Elusimicrobiales bacterium]